MTEGLVTFREGLEAALVVGILARFTPMGQRWLIGAGVGAAILLSLLSAYLLEAVAATHALWEIGFSFAAAGLLIYMVGWMRRRGAALSQELQSAAHADSAGVLFWMAFTAVAREGLETALFLRTLWKIHNHLSWVGGLTGLLLAAMIGLVIFILGKRLPIKTFFNFSSVLLLLIAAGVAAYGMHEILEYAAPYAEVIHELEEAKAWTVLPPSSSVSGAYSGLYTQYEGLYYHPLHHKGYIGAILHALMGWRANMSWAEVVTGLLTFGVGLWWWRKKA